MNRENLIQLLQTKNVITKNNKRKFCWKDYFDDECQSAFNDFQNSENFRIEEEAWFCLLKNIEPYHCEICGKLAKFTGTKKTKIPGYNTTCENCSPNKSENRLKNFKETINKRTDEDRKKIIEKTKKTRLEKYGDENYTLFSSKKFKEVLKEKYGNEFYNNHEKTRKTCLERYGVTCNLLLSPPRLRSLAFWRKNKEEIRKKQKENSLKKYGYDSPNKCPEIIKKKKDGLIRTYGSLEEAYSQKYEAAKLTNLKKHGDINYHNKEQASKTLLERHTLFENKNNCTRYTKVLELYGQGWKSLNLPIIYDGRFRYISNEYLDIIKNYSKKRLPTVPK